MTNLLRPNAVNALAVRVSPPPHPGIPQEQSIKGGPGPDGGSLAIDGPTFSPGNKIDPSRFDPLSKSLLQYVPDPNSPGNNFGLQTNMAPVIQSVPYKTQAWGLTLNHAITPNQNISFTWWRNHYSVVQEENGATAIVPASNLLTGEQSGIDNANIWLVNYEKTMSPNLVLTAGVSAQNQDAELCN